MNEQHVTAIGEPLQAGQIARITYHGSAWPHVITQCRRGITARPMSRDGTKWDEPRHVPAADVWFIVSPKEARRDDFPQAPKGA